VRISAITQDFNQMSRNFSHPRTGKFCYQIEQANADRSFKLNYELLNLDENRVESGGLVDVDSHQTDWSDRFINIAKLKAGNYQLTLKNISADTFSVKPCSGMLYYEHEHSVS
jgi:hypothetical protein